MMMMMMYFIFLYIYFSCCIFLDRAVGWLEDRTRNRWRSLECVIVGGKWSTSRPVWFVSSVYPNQRCVSFIHIATEPLINPDRYASKGEERGVASSVSVECKKRKHFFLFLFRLRKTKPKEKKRIKIGIKWVTLPSVLTFDSHEHIPSESVWELLSNLCACTMYIVYK